MSQRIRVLVVDDSAFARKVIGDTLRADRRFEVVGIARDGLEALEKIAELDPDVVTLDLVMPNLDGVGVLRAQADVKRPRFVVVSMSDGDSELGVAALRAGAFELVHKPTATANDRLYELAGELVQKLLAAAAAPTAFPPPAPAPPNPRPRPAPSSPSARRLVVIGASTGGPQALSKLLRAIPADFPVPIALVLHIPVGYTRSFAARLDEECAIRVVEAEHDLLFERGTIVVARAGMHLRVHAEGDRFRAQLDAAPSNTAHRPSVDVLFESVAPLGHHVLGVVLTGMGDDGLAGARAIHEAGGAVLVEAESSCVVYGMPRVVAEAGLAAAQVPLDEMAATIRRYV